MAETTRKATQEPVPGMLQPPDAALARAARAQEAAHEQAKANTTAGAAKAVVVAAAREAAGLSLLILPPRGQLWPRARRQGCWMQLRATLPRRIQQPLHRPQRTTPGASLRRARTRYVHRRLGRAQRLARRPSQLSPRQLTFRERRDSPWFGAQCASETLFSCKRSRASDASPRSLLATLAVRFATNRTPPDGQRSRQQSSRAKARRRASALRATLAMSSASAGGNALSPCPMQSSRRHAWASAWRQSRLLMAVCSRAWQDGYAYGA